MPFIFMDEWGQFTKHDRDQYFVVGSFTVGEPRRTAKRFRAWQQSKFPKKLRKHAEIKFSNLDISDALRLKTLKFFSNLDVRIHYAYLLRQNIPLEYWHKDRLKSGLLYTNVVGETLDLYLPTTDAAFRVFCDQRHLKGLTRSEFKNILKARLLPELPPNALVQVEMVDSTTNENIQIADWISGALAWHLEKRRLGEECYQILQHNIISRKELFQNHWVDKHGT